MIGEKKNNPRAKIMPIKASRMLEYLKILLASPILPLARSSAISLDIPMGIPDAEMARSMA